MNRGRQDIRDSELGVPPGSESRNDVQCRVHGDSSAPTLIYLPGIHGDWTLVTSFRMAVQGQVRFVEFCYPRTTEWSLDDHAQAIRSALAEAGIREGWLLAESFGSQIAWTLLGTEDVALPFRATGLILAGGFVRYPYPALLPLASRLAVHLPEAGLRMFLWIYSRYARFRHRHAPETLEAVSEFVGRRLRPGDREAVVHRLRLIARSDPRPVAQTCRLPTWSLTGFWDPIVPWPPVRRWFRKNCPGWRGDRILGTADHTVLATQPAASARLVLEWMKDSG